MNYQEVMKKVKEIISEAFDEAATLIAGFALANKGVNVAKMCRDAKPEDWQGEWNSKALEHRVWREKKTLQTSGEQGSGVARALDASRVRHATSALKRDAAAVVSALDEEGKAKLSEALIADATSKATPEDAREARRVMAPLNRAVNSFASLGTIQHIQQAIEDINEAVAGDGLGDEELARIEEVTSELITTIEFAKTMAGVVS